MSSFEVYFYASSTDGSFNAKTLQLTTNRTTVGDVITSLDLARTASSEVYALAINDKIILDDKCILSECGVADGDNIKVVSLAPRVDEPSEFAYRVYVEVSNNVIVPIDAYPFLSPSELIDSLLHQSLVEFDDGYALMLLHKGNVITYDSNEVLFDLGVHDGSFLYLSPVHFSNN